MQNGNYRCIINALTITFPIYNRKRNTVISIDLTCTLEWRLDSFSNVQADSSRVTRRHDFAYAKTKAKISCVVGVSAADLRLYFRYKDTCISIPFLP